MKLLVDMNLSPRLVALLGDTGHKTIHWSTVGDPQATDSEIMNWAKSEGYVIVTHDLDFGAILSATKALFPSVVQIRTQDVSPDKIAPILSRVLDQNINSIESGALVSCDEKTARIRILPIKND